MELRRDAPGALVPRDHIVICNAEDTRADHMCHSPAASSRCLAARAELLRDLRFAAQTPLVTRGAVVRRQAHWPHQDHNVICNVEYVCPPHVPQPRSVEEAGDRGGCRPSNPAR